MSAVAKFNHLRGTVMVVVKAVINGVEQEVIRGEHVLFGDDLPTNLAPGELDRLQRIGAVGDGANPVARAVEGEPAAATPEPQALDLGKIGEASDEELAGLYKQPSPPTVKALLEAVGADVDLAKRVLVAEKEALKGDVRTSLVKGLEKVIAAAATPEPQA